MRLPAGMSSSVGVAVRHHAVARIFAREYRGESELGIEMHRHVFQRMHREVCSSVEQRELELFDEQPFAAFLRQRSIKNAVAQRRHAEQLDLHA